jgi:predicted CXXCH cytochrome family protein
MNIFVNNNIRIMAPLLVILVSVMSWGVGLAGIPKSPMNDEYCISDCLDCHMPYLVDLPWVPFVQERAGKILICEDCHTPKHHADDSAVVVDGAGGWYRFLYEVKGIEDSGWEQNVSSAAHNEYQGETAAFEYSISDKGCACHSQYHALRNPDKVGDGSLWHMHPADVVLPSDEDKEYRHYTVYNPQAPVARPDLSGYVGPSSTVSPGIDQVMCLSCHRAHGSPYPKMLRWDFSGCKTCHRNN